MVLNLLKEKARLIMAELASLGVDGLCEALYLNYEDANPFGIPLFSWDQLNQALGRPHNGGPPICPQFSRSDSEGFTSQSEYLQIQEYS